MVADLTTQAVQPGWVAGKVGEVDERRQQRVVRDDSRRLEEGVVLQALGEDLPADRVERAVRAGVDDEGVAVGPAGPGQRIGDGERVDQLGRLPLVPVVGAPVEEATGAGPVEQRAGHPYLGKGRVEQAVDVAAARDAAEIRPERKIPGDEVGDRREHGNRQVREPLTGEVDLAQRVHHPHPRREVTQQPPRFRVAGELLRPVRLVREVEEAVLQQPLVAQETLPCRQELLQKGPIGCRGRGGRQIPEQHAVLAVPLVDADGVAGAPLRKEVRPLERRQPGRGCFLHPAPDLCPVERIAAVATPRHAEQLRRPLHAVERRREDWRGDHVLTVRDEVAKVGSNDVPERLVPQVDSVPIGDRVAVEPVRDVEVAPRRQCCRPDIERDLERRDLLSARADPNG